MKLSNIFAAAVLTLLAAFSVHPSEALELKPYVFTKNTLGISRVNSSEPEPVLSGLFEVGVKLPEDWAAAYSLYVEVGPDGKPLGIQTIGISHSFYLEW